MSRKKITWSLFIEIDFKDGDFIKVEKPSNEAREYFNFMCGCVLDFNIKCVREIRLTDGYRIVLKCLTINY